MGAIDRRKRLENVPVNDPDPQSPHEPDSEARDLVTIYAARTATDAHQLRNLLVEAGIRATVTNSVLEGGAGVDVIGWATLARVAVAERDAEAARQMALEFDQRVAAMLHESQDEPPGEKPPSGMIPPPGERKMWPVCPGCGSRRAARCPICGTEGTDFAEADPDFLGTPDAGEETTSMSCGCGSAGCSPGGSTPAESGAGCEAQQQGVPISGLEGAEAAQPPSEPPPWTLICSTCDEPFVPEHARRCARCEHEFAEGYEVRSEPREEISPRAIAVILALIALVIGFVIYFAILV